MVVDEEREGGRRVGDPVASLSALYDVHEQAELRGQTPVTAGPMLRPF